MKKRTTLQCCIAIVGVLALVTACQLPVGDSGGDTTAPTAGSAIAFSGTSSTGTTVSWGAATDNVTPAASLQYKLVRAAASASIDTLDEANVATAVMDWTANATSYAVTGLSAGTTYYFAVIVRDAADNMSLYDLRSVKAFDYSKRLVFQRYTSSFMDSEYTYVYDSQGALVGINENDIKRSAQNHLTYARNTAGQIISSSRYSAADVLLDYSEYEYNADGRQSKLSTYNIVSGAATTVHSYYVNTYDAAGQKNRSEYYLSSNPTTPNLVNTYQYDSDGNRTRCDVEYASSTSYVVWSKNSNTEIVVTSFSSSGVAGATRILTFDDVGSNYPYLDFIYF